jgi:hypothetical protein
LKIRKIFKTEKYFEYEEKIFITGEIFKNTKILNIAKIEKISRGKI